jgi:hypothetical protein
MSHMVYRLTEVLKSELLWAVVYPKPSYSPGWSLLGLLQHLCACALPPSLPTLLPLPAVCPDKSWLQMKGAFLSAWLP